MSNPRLFIIVILIMSCFILSVDKSEAKHIIVAYDISKSMYRLRNRTFMTEADLKRVNDYLTEMLFSKIAKQPRQASDDIIKPYDGEPFYKSGDLISCFQFATAINYKSQRQQGITRQDFDKLLPNPTNPSASFSGVDTFLGDAKVEIYTKLYQEGEETYWILVSDEDEDISIARHKNPAVKKVLAKIHDDYYESRVFEILVNQHVTIRVHKINPNGKGHTATEAVYIASIQNPTNPVKTIEVSKEITSGNFTSETLRIDTNNPEKGDFSLDVAQVTVVNPSGESIHTEDISLRDGAPPGDFKITLPGKDARNTNNKLEIRVKYTYKGNPKESPSFQLSYITTIDTVYVAFANSPTKPVEKIRFSKDKGKEKYVSPELVLNSECPDKNNFILENLGVHVLSKEGEEYHTDQIPLDSKKIGDAFTIELPLNVKELKQRGNQMVFNVQYQYNGEQRDLQAAATNYLLKEGTPTWPLWLILLIVAGIGCYFGGRWVYVQFVRGGPSPIIDIVLSRANASGTTRGNGEDFSLQEGDAVYFDQSEGGEYLFDVGCSGYFLNYMGKEISLFEDAFDETGRILNSGDTFALTPPDGNTVYVKLEFSSGFEYIEDEDDEFVDDEEFAPDTEEDDDDIASKRSKIISQ